MNDKEQYNNPLGFVAFLAIILSILVGMFALGFFQIFSAL